MSNRLRFRAVLRLTIVGAILLCALVEVVILVEWGRSYWTGDELAIRLPYRLIRLCSGRGQLFCLVVRNSPIRGQVDWSILHSDPEMIWNRAEVWGPTTTSFQFGSYNEAHQAMFEYATGQWMNMLTEDKPTQMRYTAVQLPHWTLALVVGIPLLIPLRRRLRRLRKRPAFEVVDAERGTPDAERGHRTPKTGRTPKTDAENGRR